MYYWQHQDYTRFCFWELRSTRSYGGYLLFYGQMCVLVSISVVDSGTILGWQSVDNKDSKRCKEKFKYKE